MEFVDIEGYEGLYKINRNGDVMSFKRKNPILLKPVKDTCGYYIVRLRFNNSSKTHSIHRLIAIHFIPKPVNKYQIDHINRIKTDNRIENLRWVNNRENSINRDFVENSRGYIEVSNYTWKNGNISTYYRLHYHLKGEHGRKNIKSKSFKTLEEAEIFRKQIYD